MNTLNRSQDVLGDVAHSLGDVVSDGGELVADLASDLVDVAESAVSMVAAATVVGIRVLGRIVTFAARRPREVVGGVVAVAVLLAVVRSLRKRSNDRSHD